MRTLLGQTDLVLECRDARIPLTSRNPVFEEALRGRARVVVFTKGDLAGGEGEEGRRGAEKVGRSNVCVCPLGGRVYMRWQG